ncbi:hypothetical protein [Ketobacter alkanivorans]|uniref:Uncharacterized protein n=1 Tax=Ketobacter alkanivorans TaxID=1917421 RepID=A0A2K9LJ86_9GAMM|nr:hypothetical protein [Ketobacter alkanivorans]AUM12300.1 hypothetical protein Kalk_07680 [Ketobacter alkanivorans]
MDAEEQTTLVGRWLIKLKNHPVVAILIMLSIIIVGVSTVLESAGNINDVITSIVNGGDSAREETSSYIGSEAVSQDDLVHLKSPEPSTTDYSFASGSPAKGTVEIDDVKVELKTTNSVVSGASLRNQINQSANLELRFSKPITSIKMAIQNPFYTNESIIDSNIGFPDKTYNSKITVEDGKGILLPPWSSGVVKWTNIETQVVKLQTSSNGGLVQFNSFEFTTK